LYSQYYPEKYRIFVYSYCLKIFNLSHLKNAYAFVWDFLIWEATVKFWDGSWCTGRTGLGRLMQAHRLLLVTAQVVLGNSARVPRRQPTVARA